jgi:hypothetical protein
MDAVMLKPEGHDEMSPLRYDHVFMLTILRMGGVLSGDAWQEKICAAGMSLGYEGFSETVWGLDEDQYIASCSRNHDSRQILYAIPSSQHLRQHGLVDPEDDDAEWGQIRWTLTEKGSMLFGDDHFDDVEADPATAAGIVTMTLKLKQDQAEVVQNALAKAKGELHTEFDTVALERLCAGYVGGVSAVAKIPGMDELIDHYGLEPLLTRVAEKFPDLDITVTEPGKR